MTTSILTFRRVSRLVQAVCTAAWLGGGGIALAADPAATAASASAPGAAALLAPITTLIGDAACDNQDECHVIGIGAKSCGGPSGHLAWSSKKTDPSALRAAVDAHAQAQRQDNASRGMLSDCMMLPAPTAVCRPRASDGKTTCQLGSGGVLPAI